MLLSDVETARSKVVTGDPDFALVSHIVLQPTTGCNLDCQYCYLHSSDRSQPGNMTVEIAERLAEVLVLAPQSVTLVWHGGEPLSIGPRRFRDLIAPFIAATNVKHYVQTNATLITEEWCRLFRDANIGVGISIDGDATHTSKRVDRKGRAAFGAILRGAALLRREGVPFSAIAVIHSANISTPREVYRFFLGLGCESLGLNFEEKEGAHHDALKLDESQVTEFWRGIIQAWKENPQLRLRELEHAMRLLSGYLRREGSPPVWPALDLFPSISWDGSVVFLAPEFLAVDINDRTAFVAGNLLTESFDTILSRGKGLPYVSDYIRGLAACRAGCPYAPVCGCNSAANRFFENGSLASSQTVFCRNATVCLVTAILSL